MSEEQLVMDKIKAMRRGIPALKKKTEAELLELFNKKYLAEQKKANPALATRIQYRNALTKFKNAIKRKYFTPRAGGFNSGKPAIGIIIGDKGTFDRVGKKRDKILKLALQNEENALEKGIIMFKTDQRTGKRTAVRDDDGNYIPREYREFYDTKDEEGNLIPVPENKKGKAIPAESYVTHYFAYASIDGQEPGLCIISFYGKFVTPEGISIPLNIPIEFKVATFDPRIDPATGLNSYAAFSDDYEIYNGESPIPDLYQLYIEGSLDEYLLSSLSELGEYTDRAVDNFNLFFVAKVDVVLKNDTPSERGNYRMVVDDDSTGFGAGEEGGDLTTEGENNEIISGVTSWVSAKLGPIYGKFGQDSKIVILGSSKRSEKKDANKNTVTDDDDNIVYTAPQITVYGIGLVPGETTEPGDANESEDRNLDDLDDIGGTILEDGEDDETDGETEIDGGAEPVKKKQVKSSVKPAPAKPAEKKVAPTKASKPATKPAPKKAPVEKPAKEKPVFVQKDETPDDDETLDDDTSIEFTDIEDVVEDE